MWPSSLLSYFTFVSFIECTMKRKTLLLASPILQICKLYWIAVLQFCKLNWISFNEKKSAVRFISANAVDIFLTIFSIWKSISERTKFFPGTPSIKFGKQVPFYNKLSRFSQLKVFLFLRERPVITEVVAKQWGLSRFLEGCASQSWLVLWIKKYFASEAKRPSLMLFVMPDWSHSCSVLTDLQLTKLLSDVKIFLFRSRYQ